jgi:hypothetical protein
MKKFFYGMVAVCVSLFVFGCEGAGDPGAPGGTGQLGNGSINGTPSPAGLQAMIDSYDGTGATLQLDNIVITGSGTVDFKTVKARVIGNLATDSSGGSLLKMANADVTFDKESTEITLGGSGDVAVVNEAQVEHADDSSTGAFAVAVAGGQAEIDAIESASPGKLVAVENYALNATTDTAPVANLTVYVYGTLTVPASSKAPAAGTLVAAGTVNLTGDNKGASGALVDATKVDVSGAEIVVAPASGTSVEVSLPATLTSVKLGANTLKVDNTTAVNVTATGTGTLELTGATTGAVTIVAEGPVVFSNTTGPVFGAASTIAGSAVTFSNGFTASENLTLSGAVSVPTGKTGTIATAKTLEVSKGTLSVAGTLTVTGAGIVKASGTGAIVIGDATNNVKLAKATLTGGGGAGATGTLTLANSNTLVLADEGAIVVTGTTGKVALVNTEFGAGNYTALDAVTITAGTTTDSIAAATGAGNGLTFSVGTGANDSIALTATSSNAASYTFAAVATSGEKITFGEVGSKAAITIPGHAANTGAVFTVPTTGTLVIGQGTNGGAVVLKYATNGGTLTTGNASVIKGIVIANALDSDGTGITIEDVTVITAAAEANATAAASNGSLVTTTGGTFEATTADVSITKATSATIGST